MDTFINDVKNFTGAAGKTIASLQNKLTEVRGKLSPEQQADLDKKLSEANWNDVSSKLQEADSLLSKMGR